MGLLSFAILSFIIEQVFPYDGTESDDTKEIVRVILDPLGTRGPEIAEFAFDGATYALVPDKRHELSKKSLHKRQKKIATRLKLLKENGNIKGYDKAMAKYKKQLFYIAEQKKGIPSKVLVLLGGDFGIDINMQDEKQRTLLFYATAQRNAYLVRYLLLLGADPEIKDYINLRPIDLLDKQNDSELYLSFHNIDVTKEAQEVGISNVHATYTYDNNNIVATKVSGEQQSNWTPLMMAIYNSQTVEAQQYINSGQDIHAETNNGSTALFFAIKNKDDAVVDLLLQHGANIEHRNKFNMNPLAFAIKTDNLYAVRTLVKHGANIQAVCASSRTPVKYAEVHRRDNIVEYLKSIGAS